MYRPMPPLTLSQRFEVPVVALALSLRLAHPRRQAQACVLRFAEFDNSADWSSRRVVLRIPGYESHFPRVAFEHLFARAVLATSGGEGRESRQ